MNYAMFPYPGTRDVWMQEANRSLLCVEEELRALGWRSVPTPARPTGGWLRRQSAAIDLVHLNWPEQYYRVRGRAVPVLDVLQTWAFVRATRRLRLPYVWEVHDLYPHGTNPVNRHQTEAIARRHLYASAASVVVHSNAAAQLVQGEFGPHPNLFVAPLGDFGAWYPRTITREQARERMRLEDASFVFLVFGSQRRNRNAALVISAFKELNRADTRLLVAGGADRGIWRRLRALTGNDERIRLEPGRVARDRVQDYLLASDVLVMPGEWYLTSAVVLLALSFGRPSIVPSWGGSAEAMGDAGGIYEQGSVQSLLAAMRSAISWDRTVMRARADQRALEFSWERHARTLSEAYLQAVRTTERVKR